MISEKAIDVSRQMDALATERFGDAYTLKTTFWNDEDFRIVVYSSKQPDEIESIPDDAVRVYVEFWYQDSRVQDGKAIEVWTIQTEDAPRGEARQEKVKDEEPVDLPDPSKADEELAQ